MEFLPRKRGISTSKNQFFCQELNFVPIELFKQRLLLERRRAERLKTHSSLMIVSISEQKFEDAALREIKLRNLVSFFCRTLRETDVISIFNSERVLILLPDTDTRGAHYVNKILHRQITQLKQDNPKAIIYSPDEFTIEIVQFPDKTLVDEEEKRKHFGQKQIYKKKGGDYLSGFVARNRLQNPKSSMHFINTCIGRNDGKELIDTITQSILFGDADSVSCLMKSMQMGLKRVFDIVASLILLIVLSPVFGIISLIIKLTSEGPVIFTQKRVGLNGKLFNFYKFRTMYKNNDEHIHKNYIKSLISGKIDSLNNGSDGDPLFKLKNDPRITPIGRFLRKTSLDELPQLWHVLKGDMSLIGPRPPIPYEVEAYEPWHLRRIYEMKPGITGLWQVSGRNKLPFSEQVRLDIKYAKRWSFLLDLKILLKTIPTVIFATGN